MCFPCTSPQAATLDRREEEICRELEGAETAGVDPALMKRMRRTLEKRADLQARDEGGGGDVRWM